MENTYWLKQTKEQPLFPDLLWSTWLFMERAWREFTEQLK